MNQYLSVDEIAAGTGLTPDQVRRAALTGKWQRRRVLTGRRGRPPFGYLMADVVAGLELAA